MESAVAIGDQCHAKLHKASYSWADIWSSPLHDLPMRDEIVYQYLPLAPEMEVLEIGPGSGFTAFRLSRYVRHITLIDVAHSTIETLKDSLHCVRNLDFVCADASAADLRRQINRRFDAAYALDMFMFVADPAAALANFRGLLKPGGSLLLSWPNYDPERSRGICHIKTLADLEELLRQAGFESWEVYTLRLHPYVRMLFHIFHEWPRRTFRRLRGRAATRKACDYDATWSHQHGRRLEPFRGVLHAAWVLFFAVARLNGPCFERTPLHDGCADGNLLLVARGRME